MVETVGLRVFWKGRKGSEEIQSMGLIENAGIKAKDSDRILFVAMCFYGLLWYGFETQCAGR
ncbi:unnamed protein product [Cylicostephanus goldi]|uniref:Uncharacterized protein n=1 Tax=Cylicostephanus goldi TaxID=71465 RepID=A0A3P6TVN0_CYLGO|nr:unnamed protein product [Cylicostephanus goldi]